MVSIVSYQDKYSGDFKSLNLEWLEKYNLTEQYDLDILNDPQGAVINKGGYVFMALDDDKVIGTAGLAKMDDQKYELIKMAVDIDWRGMGIGKLLLNHCIGIAREMGAKKISLFSNSKLQTALAMYKQFGFVDIEVKDCPLLTADVKMELSL